MVVIKETFRQYRKYWKAAIMVSISLLSALFLGACEFTREEKLQMQEISQTAKENAADYIMEKYGFAAEAVGADVCTERDGAFSHPTITGCAVVTMEYGEKRFKVHISGETDTTLGTDDFQYDLIAQDAKEYFSSILGYDVYDIYLEYLNEQIVGDPYSDRQKRNLVNELYQAGDFENFMQRHPISASVSDCENQDLTGLSEADPGITHYLEKCAAEYDAKVILISYRDEEAYQGGHRHTYGSGRILDFEIEKDGLYIASYAGFEREGAVCSRFGIQEYDGIFVSYIEQIQGSDLTVSGGQRDWMDLGNTKRDPVSEVYSVNSEKSCDITVYVPYEKFAEDWNAKRILIQYQYEDQWTQYDLNLTLTEDKQYLCFTFRNFNGVRFDFAAFS